MPDFDYLRETRDGYDATASAYAETFHDHLRDKPIDRAMLSAFAGLLEPGYLVADVGCGTGGAATRILAAVGLRVVGVDLSANMIGEARRLNPGLRYEVGRLRTARVPGRDRPRLLGEAFGERVSLTFCRRRPEAVERLLELAGLRPYARLVREPDDDGVESTPQAYLIARR